MRPFGRIVLIGMMGSGKTTVGALLAERLGRTYLDNDDVVRDLTGREPAAIAAEDGEDALHAAEALALLRAIERPDGAVVGAAAWVVLDERCRAALERQPDVIYLRARPDTLRARIGSGTGRRTDATDVRWLERRAWERDPLYAGLARLTIDVDDHRPEEVVDEIVRRRAGAIDEASALIERLGLAPHPEGGHFVETWRDAATAGARGAGSAIYYLLRAGERSAWHRVDAVEVWHHYAGAPLELRVAEGADVRPERHAVGPDIASGQRPQVVVPALAWQSATSLGDWTLVGCTVSPAFRTAGFELAPEGWEPGPRP